MAFVKRELAVNRDDFKKKANGKYDEIVGKSILKMMIAVRKAGVQNFIGGPIGAGAFMNNVKQVARLFRDGFRSGAGDMQYIYPERPDVTKPKKMDVEFKKREQAKQEKAAFMEAFQKG